MKNHAECCALLPTVGSIFLEPSMYAFSSASVIFDRRYIKKLWSEIPFPLHLLIRLPLGNL